MEELEDQALEAATLYLRMWVRYVDDTFVLWPHNKKHLVNFHLHLILQHPAIQLTMEREQRNKIAFLDVLVAKIQNFVTSVWQHFPSMPIVAIKHGVPDTPVH